MTAQLKTRKATTEDIPLLHRMAWEVFPLTYREILTKEQSDYMMEWMYSEASLEKQMTGEHHTYLIGYKEDTPIGYVSFQPDGQVWEGGMDRFHLQKIYVLPQFQKEHFGRVLFERAVGAIQDGHPEPFRLELNVNRHNKALGFYEHLGMRRLSQGDFPIGNGYYMNDYIMGMDIPGADGTEAHPFEPFLPANARVLFLGTFPAKPPRWSMEFYYPNFGNDFWRITGSLFFGNPAQFELRPAEDGKNRWDEAAIREFCSRKGLAFSDTADLVRRKKGNASDADLEIIRPRDIAALLKRLPDCRAIITTGGKASEVICERYACPLPKVGEKTGITIDGRRLDFVRLPSTSRAYPLPLEKKVEQYRIIENYL